MSAVDVIIPTRNRYSMTLAAAGSVLGQTFIDLKLLIVDDASDDGSGLRLAERFAADPRVRVIARTECGRAARARQTGFEEGTAEWVATLDSDDFWQPEKLSRQMAAADQHDVVLAWHTWLNPDGSPQVTRRPAGTGRVSPLLTNNIDVPLMRRDAVLRAGGFIGDEHTPHIADENIDFFIRLLAVSDVVVVPEVLAWCRQHGSNRTSDSMTPESLRMIVEGRRGLLDPYPDDFAEILCRLATRYAQHRDWPSWRRYLLEGLRLASPRHRAQLIWRYAPYAVRTAVLGTAA